jgi:hypothetical protein
MPRFIDLDAGWDRPFYRPLAFYLRFELGGEIFRNVHEPVPRFIQAFDRARAVADAVFRSSTALWAICGIPGEDHPNIAARNRAYSKRFAALHSLGFKIPGSPTTPTWTAPHPHYVDDPEIAEFSWRAFDLTGERALRDALIWNSIAYEMEIRPKSPIDSFLVDYEHGLMLHIYDDRGLDVFATDPMTVLSVYQEFNDWLLDYDRPRIDAMMKPLIAPCAVRPKTSTR